MTFEDMSINEKKEHIWEYYKIHIFVTLGILFFIGSLINLYIINPSPTVVLDVTVRTEAVDYDYIPVLEEDLEKMLVSEEANESVTVEFLGTGENLNPNIQMASQAKFVGKITVKEMDIIVMDQTNAESLIKEGALVDYKLLEEYYEGGAFAEVLKDISADPVTDEAVIYVVELEHFPKLQKLMGNSEAPYYVGIFNGTEHMEAIAKTLEYLFE